MAGHPYIEFEHSMAAAVGSATEAFIVSYIARERNDNQHVKLVDLLDKIKMPNPKDKLAALDRGKSIALKIKDMGLLRKFLEAGDIKIGREIYKQGRYPGAAILGIIDILVDGIPWDFKCRGYNKIQKVSPYKGWVTRHDSKNNGLDRGSPCSIEEPNPDWARQMVFYNWLVDRFDDFQYGIYEICRWEEDNFRVAIHEGTISQGFAKETQVKLESMWEKINGLAIDIPVPEYSTWKCNPFGSPCVVADKCYAYREHLEDEAKS